MFLAVKVVSDIPVVGLPLAGYAGATLNVLRACLLSAPGATDVGTEQTTSDNTTGRGEILSTSGANLVSQDAPNDGTGNRSWNIGIALLLNHLFALDPAALLRRSDHGSH